MAAIGGIFNREGRAVDADALVKMSKAMICRGGEEREAYVNGDIGLFWGKGKRDETCPMAVCRGDITLLCDGEIFTGCDDGRERARFFGESDAQVAVEAYRKYGSSLGESVSGEFSIAVYDAQRRELLLLRDPWGARPLYYIDSGREIIFASEIKGLLAVSELPVKIEKARLCEHIFSPCGGYDGAMLYSGISQIGRGGGCVCSRLSVSSFAYKGNEMPTKENGHRIVDGGIAIPDERGLERLLSELLFAFDYPQFDCFMPSFLRDVRRAGELGGSVAVSDSTLCADIYYSAERRDRLCCMAGIRAACVPPVTVAVSERELKKMEKTVKSLLFNTNREALTYIFGADWEKEVANIGNTERRIRAMGMMIQAVTFCEGYPVRLV